MKVGSPPERQVRAKHDDETLVVYQAYAPRDRRARGGRGHVRGAVQARADDLDQAVVPVDDVPLRLGDEARPGAGAGGRRSRAPASSGRSRTPAWPTSRPRCTPTDEAWQERKRTSPVRVQWDPERSIALERARAPRDPGRARRRVRRPLRRRVDRRASRTSRRWRTRSTAFVRRASARRATALLPLERPLTLSAGGRRPWALD